MHEGGRTTQWALEIMNGERDRKFVGLMGPSGGGLLEADHALLATDETGFPAAARILENLPSGATGRIFLEAEEGGGGSVEVGVLGRQQMEGSKGELLVQLIPPKVVRGSALIHPFLE